VHRSEKREATKVGAPWVKILTFAIDDESKLVELDIDYNDIFVARLIKNGYRGPNDAAIVEAWFYSVCREVYAEEFSEYITDPAELAMLATPMGMKRYET
jgi:hypothetical protein